MSSDPPSAALSRTGLLHGAAAHAMWGLLPLYLLPLRPVAAGEILADRIIWSLVLVIAVVAIARRWRPLRAALAPRTLGLLACTAALITVNWLVYIWAVQHHHVLEASLGYFLNPLVNVLLGVVVLRERLTRFQVAAIALAAAGVAVLATGASGSLWITGALAVSFSLYGFVRKIAPVEALEGLTIETALLTVPSLGYMAWLAGQGGLAFGRDGQVTALLMLGGVVTALPLLLFASAARRLPYSVLALIVYITPSLQFLLAVSVFGEAVTPRHILCFALIWSGIALFVVGTLRQARAAADA